MTDIKIFISHSSEDRTLAEALIELIRSAISLSPDVIRCTSVDGFRLPAGSAINEKLRYEINQCEHFIALVTPSSAVSTWVMFELGARWGVNKSIAPVLRSAHDKQFLIGPLNGYNALACDDSTGLHQLIETLSDELKIPLNRPTSYQHHLRRVVDVATRSLAQSGVFLPPVIESSKAVEKGHHKAALVGGDPNSYFPSKMLISQCVNGRGWEIEIGITDLEVWINCVNDSPLYLRSISVNADTAKQ